jgi:TonB family protein
MGCAVAVQQWPSELLDLRLNDPAVVCDELRSPQLVSKVPPRYPEQRPSSAVGIPRVPRKGSAVVEVILGQDGLVKQAHVVWKSHPGFAAPALEAIRQLRYTPATCDGAPVEVVFPVRIDWT